MSERIQIYIALNLITSIIGTLASALHITLMYRMKITGFILLILTMSWFQIMYDWSFFFSNIYVGYYITIIANFFQLCGGIGGALISNFIAFTVLFVVWKKQSFDIFKHFKLIFILSFLPGLVDGIIYVYSNIPENAHPNLTNVAVLDIYYNIRLISILLNFIVFGVSAYFIRMMRSKGPMKTRTEIAINTLSRRLIFYPIIQVGYHRYCYIKKSAT